jgi:Asp-tRNA(Asn)/Glu-tRNA(Gln) amidotransferase A subunit family amidase
MAPILGVPQIHIPMPDEDGIPRGLSVMGPRGSDLALLGLARAWAAKLP